MGRHSILKERKQNPKKRLEIIEGLTVFFKSHSLAKSNMDEIAVGMNKSKATLYKYFKSKEEMVDALVNHRIEKIVGFVPILIDDEIPFLDRYEQSFSLLLMHISDITIDFIDDLKTVYPLIYKNIELLIDLAVRELAAFYGEGMKRGVFNDLNAKMLSQIDFILFQTLTDPIYLKANGLTVGEAFQDFYNIRCQGLLVK